MALAHSGMKCTGRNFHVPAIEFSDSVLSIYQKWEMEKPEVSNGDTESDQPIPDSKPDINTDSKPDNDIDNDNDRIVDVSYNESSHESLCLPAM